MMRLFLFTCFFLPVVLSAQTTGQKLQKAFQQFESDSQLKHAISSLYVIDAKTGEVVFDKNGQVGLVPASTQKIITSVTAFELLGKDYRYQTRFGYQGTIAGRKLKGRLLVIPSGDPTLGSWRYEQSNETNVINRVVQRIRSLKIDSVDFLAVDDSHFEVNNIPDGWIWQDIGNYYGAGSYALNWRENQYDIALQSGNTIGDDVEIARIKPALYGPHEIKPKLKSAAKGSGDNAYIYLPVGVAPAYIKGTIPVNEKQFTISGALPNPVNEFQSRLLDTLKRSGISSRYEPAATFNTGEEFAPINEKNTTIIHTEYSPALDSIIYWFLKKSINLYGEALLKTLSYEKQGFGSTDSGVAIIRKFWKDKGMDPDELNMADGSGLSPLNRVTTHAQVAALQFAKKRDWFPSFYDALPEYNGMKMKSGTISDVKGFCGYHTSKDGREYIFSFLVNNYNGRTSGVVNKMYKVLDELK